MPDKDRDDVMDAISTYVFDPRVTKDACKIRAILLIGELTDMATALIKGDKT